MPNFQSLVIQSLDIKVFSLLIHQNLLIACCLLGTSLGSGYTTENKMNKASALMALQFSGKGDIRSKGKQIRKVNFRIRVLK